MSTQTIALLPPSTPTASAATLASFGSSISPRASSIEARLELSLDELIKERKKEVKKDKKHESVKKETTAAQHKKQPAQQQQQQAKQAEKRSALVNKNRGLPALADKSKSAGSGAAQNGKPAKKSKKPAPTTVPGKKAANANTNANKQSKASAAPKASKKAAATTPVVTAQSPSQQQKKAKKQQVLQQSQQPAQKLSKKQKKQQQHAAPQQIARVVHPPKLNQQLKAVKAKTKSAVVASPAAASSKVRKVVRSNDKASKIRITIQQPTSAASKRSQKKATAPQKTAIMNVVLPAKVARNFSSQAAVRAQKLVRRVQSRKPATSKNGAFVVRKPFTVRKI